MGRIYLADIKIQQYIDGLAASGEAISPVYGLVIGQVRDVEKKLRKLRQLRHCAFIWNSKYPYCRPI